MTPVTVSECTYKKLRRGDLGLELEVEAFNSLPDVKTMGWGTKTDGSLRYIGKEYITSSPIKRDDHKKKKLEFLVDSILKDGSGVQKNSHRTSFHVHRNIGDWECHMPWTAACAYWMFENPLMAYCGKHRVGNQFCLRLKDATGVIGTCRKDIRDVTKSHYNPFVAMAEDDIKYGGLNIKAIANYGSMEFRGMRGELDAGILDTWSNELFDMTGKAAAEFKDPAQFMDEYFGHDPVQFMGKFFSKEFMNELIKINGDKIGDMITENELLVCEIAYSADWDKWKKKVIDNVRSEDTLWSKTVEDAKKAMSKYVSCYIQNQKPEVISQEQYVSWFDRGNKQIQGNRLWAETMVRKFPHVGNVRGDDNAWYISIDRLLKRGAYAPRQPEDIGDAIPGARWLAAGNVNQANVIIEDDF